MRGIARASVLAVFLPGPLLAAPWTPEGAFKVKRVTAPRVSPDGARVAYVVGEAQMEGEKSEWLSQIHVARADGSGSFQLTRGDKSATAPTWSPDGRWIAFVAARGGKDKDGKDPRPNVWRIRVEGGEAEALTDEKGAVAAPRFSPDGRWIAFLRTDPKGDDEEKAEKEKRDVKVIDENLKRIRLCVAPAEKDALGRRPVRVLTPGEMSIGHVESAGDFGWSPDSRRIVFDHQPRPYADEWTKSDVSIVDVESGRITPFASTAAAEGQPAFSPDGQWVALGVTGVPPTWRGASRVHVVSAQGGAPRALAPTGDEQPDILGWSADGRRVIVRETAGTVNRLFALPVDGAPAVALTPADVMVEAAALNVSRTKVGFTSQAPDRPPEAYVTDLERFAPVQVSHAQDMPAVELGRTEVVTWQAPDGKTIEGLLTYPVGYRAGSRVPLLVIVHGGPSGVFLRAYIGVPTAFATAGFAERGYAVLRCNVRGSSGYGREFRHANYKDWGGGDYRDIVSGIDALAAKGIADPERLGIMGWSYGGYMTSWVITQTHRFKAATVGAGVTNLMSFTGTADIPSFIPDYFGGEFWEVFDAWRAHSAMFNIKGVTTPTRILHGEADLRVPISQGYELYNALKRQGVSTKMVVYPRQPHGLQEPKFVLDAMKRTLEWFDRWVPAQDARATSAR
jgi:dipeptidyl aminopeptidase/acylaminoacyl peptidase